MKYLFATIILPLIISCSSLSDFYYVSCSIDSSSSSTNNSSNISSDYFSEISSIGLSSFNSSTTSSFNSSSIISENTSSSQSSIAPQMYYTLVDNNHYSIAEGTINTNDTIVIPSVIGSYPVESIANYGFTNSTVTNITLPSTITYIGDYAFLGCTNLIHINMESMTAPELGANPFEGVTNCILHIHSGATGYRAAPSPYQLVIIIEDL